MTHSMHKTTITHFENLEIIGKVCTINSVFNRDAGILQNIFGDIVVVSG
jgi:hypothetical protein